MQDEGHHHAAASAQVRAFGRLLKNEAVGPGKAAKVEDGPEKFGENPWQNMAKYGQILPIWGKIDPWSILVHEKLEKKLLVGVFPFMMMTNYYLLPRGSGHRKTSAKSNPKINHENPVAHNAPVLQTRIPSASRVPMIFPSLPGASGCFPTSSNK